MRIAPLLVSTALALVGCDVQPSLLAGPPVDAGPPHDGAADGAAHDAGTHDAAAAHDAGHVMDAGPHDGGAHDAGHHDAGHHDAGNDAHVAHDAYVCPTWSHDIQPLLRRHCGACHGSVRPAFVSSQSTAHTDVNAILSAGTRPGSMSYRDPLGGLSHADDAELRAWVACGAH
jgi:hypothetical protein